MSSSRTDLELLLRGSKTATEPGVKVALARLASEAKLRLERGSPSSFDFFHTSVRALSQIKGTAHSEVRMSCLFDCGNYFFLSGYTSAALETAESLEALAELADSKAWLRKARCLMGIVQADGGNIADAIVRYASALELAEQIEDVEGQIIVLGNLGTALNYAGLFGEAIPCFRRAVWLAEGTPNQEFRKLPALTNLAQTYLYLEDFEQGFESISKAINLSKEPKNASEAVARAIREYTFVQLALENGLLEIAREHCHACERYSHWGDNPRSQYLSRIARGLCEIHGGNVEHGLSLLEEGLARSGEMEAARTAALSVLVRAYDEVGKPERALMHLDTLLETIKQNRQNGIHALLRIQDSSSSVIGERGKDLRALELREAKLRAKVAEHEVATARFEALGRLAVTADLKEEASGEHGYRVGHLCFQLAQSLHWPNEACQAIELAARLHDIGKIAVPDRVLFTTEKLKAAERHVMCTHTVIGAELLAQSNDPQLQIAQEIALSHHEWWDGNGYPRQLSGKRIPIHARIVALADVFDALTHGRPYSPAWSIDRAMEEIRSRKGTQFDPELTDQFLALVDELRAKHPDLDEFLGRAGRNSPFLQARRKIKRMLSREREEDGAKTPQASPTRH